MQSIRKSHVSRLRMFQCLKMFIWNYQFVLGIICFTGLCFTSGVYTDLVAGRTLSVFDVLRSMKKSDMVNDIELCNISVFATGLSTYVNMFLPLLCSFVCVFMMGEEEHSEIKRLITVRMQKSRYCRSYYFSGVLSGGILAVLGYGIFGLFVYFLFPGVQEYSDMSTQLFGVTYSNYYIFIFMRLFSVFLYGIQMTGVAISLTPLFRNEYIVETFVFVLNYLSNSILIKYAGQYTVIKYFLPGSVGDIWLYKEMEKGAVLGIFTVYLLLGYILYKKFLERGIDYGK